MTDARNADIFWPLWAYGRRYSLQIRKLRQVVERAVCLLYRLAQLAHAGRHACLQTSPERFHILRRLFARQAGALSDLRASLLICKGPHKLRYSTRSRELDHGST